MPHGRNRPALMVCVVVSSMLLISVGRVILTMFLTGHSDSSSNLGLASGCLEHPCMSRKQSGAVSKIVGSQPARPLETLRPSTRSFKLAALHCIRLRPLPTTTSSESQPTRPLPLECGHLAVCGFRNFRKGWGLRSPGNGQIGHAALGMGAGSGSFEKSLTLTATRAAFKGVPVYNTSNAAA